MIHEHVHKLRKHKNILYSLVVLLVILQVISFLVVISQVTKVTYQIGQVREDLSNSIKSAEEKFTQQLEQERGYNQQNFKDIINTLARQQEEQSDFKQEIALLQSGSGDFSAVIEQAVKGVVSVSTDISAGSGFFINTDGYVVTNRHVLVGARRVSVQTYDDKSLAAVLIGADKERDLALLKVSGTHNALSLADSNNLQVGQKVIAIGNPLGLSFTVTQGILSALDREGLNGLPEYIQTDVSLNPGNSGGPLIDVQGKVIGINNFKVGGAESLGFALESNSVRNTINEIALQNLNQTII